MFSEQSGLHRHAVVIKRRERSADRFNRRLIERRPDGKVEAIEVVEVARSDNWEEPGSDRVGRLSLAEFSTMRSRRRNAERKLRAERGVPK